MAGVNLEELALRSIEQYASLGVRLASLEQAIIESNRRFETSQEKFINACDKISRMEEKISRIVEDKTVMHKRIDDTRAEVDKLVLLVRDLTDNVKAHKTDHCGECPNSTKLEQLEKDFEKYFKGDKDLAEARKRITSHHGMLFTRFITSKFGIGWIVLISFSALITIYNNTGMVKQIWDFLKLFTG